jgi:hypothetical protein
MACDFLDRWVFVCITRGIAWPIAILSLDTALLTQAIGVTGILDKSSDRPAAVRSGCLLLP